MSDDINVIWRAGEGEMPSKARHVVDAARSEVILRALQLPEGMVDMIIYNSEKSAQSVPEYISTLLAQQLKTA
ncbi:MAG: hypothetical protein LBP28_00070 [Coriobacteriales bacterium]|jgi:hypothetical protein|nr:hypothetical protein [Coriobacteriales bacterium]